ncbi:MAG: RNA polymerase sigma factor [Planctomycetota bacterium]
MPHTTTTAHMDDATLLQQAATGDELALAALLDQHLAAVRAWLLRRCATPDVADELALDAFLPDRLRNFSGDSAPRTYLIGVAQNLWLHHQRDAIRERKRDVRPLDQAADVADPAAVMPVERLAQQELADRILARLDPREQQIFRLRYQLGLEFGEIAEAIGEHSVDTVRSQHRRTLVRLRTELQERTS